MLRMLSSGAKNTQGAESDEADSDDSLAEGTPVYTYMICILLVRLSADSDDSLAEGTP